MAQRWLSRQLFSVSKPRSVQGLWCCRGNERLPPLLLEQRGKKFLIGEFGLAVEQGVLDRVKADPFNIGMGKADHLVEKRVGQFQTLVAKGAQFALDNRWDLLAGRPVKADDFVKAPPERPVEQPFMVGGGDDEAGRVEVVEQLQKTVDHPLEFAMFAHVVAALADGVKFVKEEHPPPFRCVLEDFAQVGRGLPQIGRDDRIETGVEQRQPQLAGQHFGGKRLATAGRATKEQPSLGAHAVGFEQFTAAHFGDHPFQQPLRFRADNQIGPVAVGLTDLQQTTRFFTVAGQRVKASILPPPHAP